MDNILELIKEEFTIDGEVNKRYYHTIGVIEMANKLNVLHKLGLNEEQVTLAAAFHDIAKLLSKDIQLRYLEKYYQEKMDEIKKYPDVWHSFVGSIYAKEKYNITDEKVLDAIKYHTTGKPDMNSLEKIIFVSDYIEEVTRKRPQMIEARKIAYRNLDAGVIRVLEDTIEYLNTNNKSIYYLTNDTYQYYLKEKKNV